MTTQPTPNPTPPTLTTIRQALTTLARRQSDLMSDLGGISRMIEELIDRRTVEGVTRRINRETYWEDGKDDVGGVGDVASGDAGCASLDDLDDSALSGMYRGTAFALGGGLPVWKRPEVDGATIDEAYQTESRRRDNE